MARLGELDLPDRLAPVIPRWLTEVGVALLCATGAIMLRAALDIFAAGGAPFAFVYPAAILATLFARWRAGAITSVLTILYVKYYLFPELHSFRITAPNGQATVALIIVGAMLTVGIADMFRRIARAATEQRDREIADKNLLLAEFDHRMKNNFQIVASILDIQRRRVDGEAAEALGVALHRVESIGRAHRQLYRGDGQQGTVEMRDYLGGLCDALADALLLRGGIALQCRCDEASVPRDRAVSIGLVVNELVTNAAKHAFQGRAGGTITVSFRSEPAGWTLVVSDDGVGISPREPSPTGADHGLGSRLIPAFARQAGGTIKTESGPDGTAVTMELPA